MSICLSWISTLLILACLGSTPLSAQAHPTGRISEEVAARAALEVDRLLDRKDMPGAAVMVIQDGRILLRKGYGLASLETRAPIAPDTAFLLGSMTKAFTAMAVMILAERGQLDYDDPLSRHLPEFRGTPGQVTLRQLLHHTGGFPEFEALLLADGQIDFNWPRSASTPSSPIEPTSKDVLALLANVQALRFPPGTKWEYCNSGYVLLAQVVERVSGQPFPAFLKEAIFDPLGMSHTVLATRTRPVIPAAATGYAQQSGIYQDIDYAPHRAVYGHSNVYSTLDDLYRWDQALYSERLVSTATLREAFTPGRLADGTPVCYGFGWRLARRSGFDVVEHGGSSLGFRTVILRVPERRFTAIALSNLSRFDLKQFADTIDQAYLQPMAGLVP